MKQSLFESRHQPEWQRFSQLLEQLERRQAKAEDCLSFPRTTAACANTWRWPKSAATAAT